jgi:hypothetical protein
MNDDRAMSDIRDWLASEGNVDAPTRLFEGIYDATHDLPQVRTLPRWLPEPGSSWSRRGFVLVAAAAVVLALGVAAVTGVGRLLLRTLTPAPVTLEILQGQLFAPTCPHPRTLTAVGDAVWVACLDQIRRFDASTGAVSGAVPAGALAVDASGAWIAAPGGAQSLDPATLARGPLVRLPDVTAIALDASSAWAIQPGEQQLVRIDRATSQETGAAHLTSRPAGLVAAAGKVWVLLPDEDRVAVVDPEGPAVTHDVAVAQPLAIAAGSGSIWVVSGAPPAFLVRIDPSSLATSTTALQGPPAAASGGPPVSTTAAIVEASGNAVWVIDGSRLEKFDPTSVALTGLIEVRAPDPVALGGAAPLGDQLLVIDAAQNRLLRLNPSH